MIQVVTIETPSLGDRSYIVHDGSHAMVIDPQRDTDRVLEAIRDADVSVTHVAETHVHNDYVTGGLVLARQTDAAYVHATQENLAFDHRGVEDGDTFTVGSLAVEVVATPGHTPHHLSYVVTGGDGPAVAFTGGSLLHGTVGRTDLIGSDQTDELTRLQHRSAHRLAELLDDDAGIYPTHGFGSFCASASSEEESDGSMGTERAVNIASTVDDEDEFVDQLVSGLSAHPRYYAHMGPLNRSGPSPADLSPPAPVDPTELARRIHAGEWVVDIRNRRAFATDHVTGTIGIELADPFATYLGWLIPWGTPITLVGDTSDEVADAQRQLVRIGIDRPTGAAHGDVEAWAGDLDRRDYPVIEFPDVRPILDDPERDAVVLDVRRDDEWADGHIDGAAHVPIHELLDRLDDVPDRELLVHCESGFRASICSALLDRAGRRVVLIDDAYENASDTDLELTG